jgi:hypothetical protein
VPARTDAEPSFIPRRVGESGASKAMFVLKSSINHISLKYPHVKNGKLITLLIQYKENTTI